MEVTLGLAGSDSLVVQHAFQQFGCGGHFANSNAGLMVVANGVASSRCASQLACAKRSAVRERIRRFAAAISSCGAGISRKGGASSRLGSICSGVRYTRVFGILRAGLEVCENAAAAQQKSVMNRGFVHSSLPWNASRCR